MHCFTTRRAFGKHLSDLRKKASLTQEELANDADIPLPQVGRIERREVNTN
ncbi:MAG: helix-turn-helix transcriptional regulator, partial [Flavobacteriaceae bacterium]|nr:helix-turn-helix transcriptional regulator [Flavobacteriaceae bacterium]